MKKLYEIKFVHYAQRGSDGGTEEFVVANSHNEVFDYLAKGYANWNDILEYGLEEAEDEDKKDYLIEQYNEIRLNHSDDRELSDLYYGQTQYFWEEVELVDNSVIELMIKNNLAKDIRRKK